MLPERPPILLLGTSERVGSNWTLDVLRHATIQHNEPFRQQLGVEHPYAPLASSPNSDGSAPLAPLAAHWVDTFVLGKYLGGAHIVKETNLYFATERFLDLFPESPVLVLSRSPLGVASSFVQGDLWGRWEYDSVYRRVVAMTHETGHDRWANLVPDDSPVASVALTRLVTLNTALLAEALSDREHAHLSYESAVLDRVTAMRPITRLVPEAVGTITDRSEPGHPEVDDTFATNRAKHELTVCLSPGEVELVNAETERGTVLLREMLAPQTAELAGSWLAGADRYQRVGSSTRVSRSPRTAAPPLAPPPTPAYVEASPKGALWRNTLVSNSEMCAFLNGLAGAGAENTIHGVRLLAIDVPHERGGRLHLSKGGWRVSPGFEHHPAYWVTWIGAAAYALSAGARLPNRAEMNALSEGAKASNIDYAVGDTTSVVEPGSGPGTVHHRVGNLQVWCADGPQGEPLWAPVTRDLHGAAWNTPGTREEVRRLRSRHLLGASRGVGVRLVRDRASEAGLPLGDIADRLHTWVTGLGGHDHLADPDRKLISVLSQTDR